VWTNLGFIEVIVVVLFLDDVLLCQWKKVSLVVVSSICLQQLRNMQQDVDNSLTTDYIVKDIPFSSLSIVLLVCAID